MAVEDALPDTGSGEPRFRALDPTTVLAAAGTFLTLVLLAEGASRLAARTGFWYSRFDFSGTVASLPELEDRVAWAASKKRPVFLLGDSVLGATALLEHGAPAPRRSALAAQLAEQERTYGRHVVSLAADGMLLPDLEAESRLLATPAPAGGAGDRRALVVLNFRMFASELEDSSKTAGTAAVSRGFGTETSAGDRAVRYSALLRSSELLKSLWYFPTRRDFFRRAAERALGRDSDPEIQEAALRLKVAPYYRNRWREDSPAFRALDGLLKTLGPARVVLTPQNPDFVEEADVFAANRALLASFLKARGSGIEYLDWADRYPSDRFLDHCHLTADGNREYAAELARWVDR